MNPIYLKNFAFSTFKIYRADLPPLPLACWFKPLSSLTWITENLLLAPLLLPPILPHPRVNSEYFSQMLVFKRLVKLCHPTAPKSPVVPLFLRVAARVLLMALRDLHSPDPQKFSVCIFCHFPICCHSATLASAVPQSTKHILASASWYHSILSPKAQSHR